MTYFSSRRFGAVWRAESLLLYANGDSERLLDDSDETTRNPSSPQRLHTGCPKQKQKCSQFNKDANAITFYI